MQSDDYPQISRKISNNSSKIPSFPERFGDSDTKTEGSLLSSTATVKDHQSTEPYRKYKKLRHISAYRAPKTVNRCCITFSVEIESPTEYQNLKLLFRSIFRCLPQWKAAGNSHSLRPYLSRLLPKSHMRRRCLQYLIAQIINEFL